MKRLALIAAMLIALTHLVAAQDNMPRITLTAKTTTWFQIRDIGTNRMIVSKVLKKGQSYQVPKRKGLILMTGNAGGVEIFVDGEAMPAIGRLGEVLRNVLLDAQSLRQDRGVVKTTTYNPEHLKRLKETNKCPNCNLRGADLRDARLQKTNLQSANLYGADLRGADLRDARLQKANLQSANLNGADLRGADLRETNLWRAEFQAAKLNAKGIRIARASGAINVPGTFTAGKSSPTISVKNSPESDLQKGRDAYDKRDYSSALHLWKPLAEQGNARAQDYLGWMYHKGQGIPKNDETAVKWYRLAAEQRDAYAQYHLGMMYRKGWGIRQNHETALEWFRLSAAQANYHAQAKLKELQKLARRTQGALRVLGLYSEKLDGVMGLRTKSAIQKWQKRKGLPSTGEVTEIQLAQLEQEAEMEQEAEAIGKIITALAKKKSDPKTSAKKSPSTVTARKSPKKGRSLLPCPGTYSETTWTDCFGTLTFHSGSKYVGRWKSGKQHGQGTLTYADGEKYVGGFKNGLHHGNGTITHANGKTLKGIWENDKFKSARD